MRNKTAKPTDPRHEARRVALATLFERAFHSNDPSLSSSLIEEVYEEREVDEELLKDIIDGVTARRGELDQTISEAAPAWPPEQINKVDLIALRIAIWELLFNKKVPEKVAIDEAIEISKEFGSSSSGSFVNGVLGTVVEEKLEGKTVEKKEKDDGIQP
ncbi:MAG: NusB antitermination factor, N utilization substance protein B [candidate division CPR1 bacterium GW2011_GWC1_49_13]|uniref:Transcription antitermination protein NusB n=1 Tax=candidate division CPR1 bacterium GW2011_GWC1_49_13 TaxID=1618342 RepID=A0A0G1VG85_9BACT|nr:MAG: NusB antitermination factor, N utilization substance protein B [candidate division CPR1 bacterium GW2011_GWC1_49_13]